MTPQATAITTAAVGPIMPRETGRQRAAAGSRGRSAHSLAALIENCAISMASPRIQSLGVIGDILKSRPNPIATRVVTSDGMGWKRRMASSQFHWAIREAGAAILERCYP